MFTVFVIGAALLIAALLALSHWCAYRAGRETGYEQRIGDERQERADEQAAKGKAGRHARTEPRTSLVKPRAVLPIPGPGKPQAARTSEPGTAIIPKHGSIGTFLDQVGVSPRLGLPATTGEMQAITDDYITQMKVDEETFRLGLAT